MNVVDIIHEAIASKRSKATEARRSSPPSSR